MYEYKAKVMYVADGDTVDVVIDLGFGVMLGCEYAKRSWVRLRLAKINAFETALRGSTTPEQKELGLQAKKLAEDLLLGTWVTLKTYVDETPKGSFGRWLADICFQHEGDLIDWGDLLISRGLAVPYEG